VKIITIRRICQTFFLVLFLWFSIVATFGTDWWQLRGWPVNLMLQLDPLVAIGTLLTTHTIYKGLIWALVTVVLTVLFGRFFCGWICPFGALHQFFGYLGNKNRKLKDRIISNRYRKAASLKYLFLIAFLAAAALPLGHKTILLTGLLDPIPFFHRSINIIVLPIADQFSNLLSVVPRAYEGAYLIGALFTAAIFMNFLIPRFYCRFICPTGALLGLISKYSIFKIGKRQSPCSDCMLCEKSCEGGCEPSGKIRITECLLCFNCYAECQDNLITYQIDESKAGEIVNPDFTRRGLILSSVSGLLAVQLFPLSKGTAATRNNSIIRPPGSLTEEDFLQRCIKCSQCMRICPTNIIVPSGIFGGIENMWTPVLNFTQGTSGCQLTCTACGHICPTSAIRPIRPSEKLGIDDFSQKGPIRIGTAFVDRSRCLPWAMQTPCIVCQETCPVTPKAIYVTEKFETVPSGARKIMNTTANGVRVSGTPMEPDRYATGDYYLMSAASGKQARHRISANSQNTVELGRNHASHFKGGDPVIIQILLHQPQVDIKKCIGCGICEHECPLDGKRAIRITAENESRAINS